MSQYLSGACSFRNTNKMAEARSKGIFVLKSSWSSSNTIATCISGGLHHQLLSSNKRHHIQGHLLATLHIARAARHVGLHTDACGRTKSKSPGQAGSAESERSPDDGQHLGWQHPSALVLLLYPIIAKWMLLNGRHEREIPA
jgi:hypothetical protein